MLEFFILMDPNFEKVSPNDPRVQAFNHPKHGTPNTTPQSPLRRFFRGLIALVLAVCVIMLAALLLYIGLNLLGIIILVGVSLGLVITVFNFIKNKF